jgi:CHAD domain-containing protein
MDKIRTMALPDPSDLTTPPTDSNAGASTRRPIRAVMKRYRPSRKALHAASAREGMADDTTAIHPPSSTAAAATTARRLDGSWTLPGMSPAQTLELWLAVPQERRAQIEHFVRQRTGVRWQRATILLDTPAGDLASAQIELALQRERGGWTQKLSSMDSEQKHAVPLNRAGEVPRGELSRHAGHPLGRRAIQAIGGSEAQLGVRATCVEHIVARTTRRGGYTVELEFSRWRSRAANDGASGSALMLRGSDASMLVDLAQHLAQRFGLWLQADRATWRAGLLLNSGHAVGARALRLDTAISPSAALASMVENCLWQIVPNVAALAAGRGQAEHLHQARVGIRRLRAALRAFGAWAEDVDAAWEPALTELFRRFGAQRDRDVIQGTVFPAIVAAGGPVIQSKTPDPVETTPQQAARDPRVTSLLLSLQNFIWNQRGNQHASADVDAAATRERASGALRKMHAQLRRDAKRFAHGDVERQHRTRKRLKRLRYCAEFAASLFPRRQTRRFLDALRPAQEAIGRYTDLLVAEDQLLQETVDDAGRWFALGWVAARRAPAIAKAEKSLRRSLKAPPPW